MLVGVIVGHPIGALIPPPVYKCLYFSLIISLAGVRTPLFRQCRKFCNFFNSFPQTLNIDRQSKIVSKGSYKKIQNIGHCLKREVGSSTQPNFLSKKSMDVRTVVGRPELLVRNCFCIKVVLKVLEQYLSFKMVQHTH